MRDIRNLFVKFDSSTSKNDALNSSEAEKIFFTPTGDIVLNGIDYTNHQDYILASQKGVAGGVASLDEDGKVPDSQIPEDVIRINSSTDKIPSSLLPSYVDDVVEFVLCYAANGNPLGQGRLYRPTVDGTQDGDIILGLTPSDTQYFIPREQASAEQRVSSTELFGTPATNPSPSPRLVDPTKIYYDLLDKKAYCWGSTSADDRSIGWIEVTSNSTARGERGKIYVAPETGKCYRWSGTRFVEIVASPGSSDEITEGNTNLYYTAARAAEKAEKSEMSITPGTGADSDKTTIQLKEGLSATVLTEHMPKAVPSVNGVGGTDGYLDRTDFQLLMSGNVAQRWT